MPNQLASLMPVKQLFEPFMMLANQQAYKCYLADGSNANKCNWQASRCQYHHVECNAKVKYFTQLAMKANKHAIRNGPKGTWEAV